MAFIDWNKNMSVGVERLDEDHRKLIAIINQLHDGIQAGHKREILDQVLHELVEYTKVHFANEERLFAQTDFAGAAVHISEHESLVQRILNVARHFEDRPVSVLDYELMSFLQTWLLNHIQTTDKKYSAWFNSHGIF
jgi:hemerythrin